MSIARDEAALLRAVQNVRNATEREFGNALYAEVLIEEKESKSRTPVDLGPLRASHETTLPVKKGNMIIVEIKVGGPSAPYALAVHEDLEAFHESGEAKFLERTLQASRPHLARRIANRIDLRRMAR